MIVLLTFAFISGLVTILAPCIWPLLPIILSASATGGKRKPLGITLGIIISFAFFTLTLSYIVKIIPFNPDGLRLFAVLIIGFFGLTLLIPALSQKVEGAVSALSNKLGIKPSNESGGFWGGLLTGLALGVVWSPCAGPILATIATLAATRTVNTDIVLVTIVYVIGVGIPLFFFALLGNKLFTQSKKLSKYTGKVQQVFGAIMIITSVLIFTNYDKVLQAKLLDAIPAYSKFIYDLEGNEGVKKELDRLRNKKDDKGSQNQPFSLTDEMLPNLGKAPDFVGIAQWLNTDKPVSMKDLKGKVVLVDFWTYTCINCIRTLPYVTSWYDKYKEDGLVVVGVHTPEFEFEKNTKNVEQAIQQYKIHYPVGQDNDYETWRAYDNHYWPAKYLIDKDGNIRYYHFGEGDYDVTEKNIQKLLEEKGTTVKEPMVELQDETPRGFLTPETYLGSLRVERFASDEQFTNGRRTFTLSRGTPEHYFSYGGAWLIDEESSTSDRDAVLEFNFTANKVFLVITPRSQEDLANLIYVYIDGKKVDASNAGVDVEDGRVAISTPRLYNLVDLHGEKGSHVLRLEFKSKGIKIYAFTFG
ncbi:hypothetical protein A3G67_00395 [Candidatus Roizmanbacteria bacterium RIFCSPLOWO2_12_FULL_40_12]|nr:MAG: hypothetical protein A2W49_04460 [Candidatus Roizmanbacteria bacterium RIFCSPHIGHO2_12_41_18]OGK58924.1 MAG: hypothetical protein A3H84_04340 [Candidatus Roizmanbacteria bacterium RIFCSPLOWO2_02_FULL_40_13]OGK61234.1 MAG: hypothetical protein A3G67_00395 [Candidatus Roizmanbacteria bacterium RIFCSPLOWO2_12_FULL_40_12]